MTGVRWVPALAAASLIAAAPNARAGTFDVDAAQAILAVQELDGWLLYSAKRSNPIALEMVAPRGEPTRGWFYFIPTEGQPMALIHRSEAGDFADVPGTKMEYTGARDLKGGLRQMLKGVKKVAMEYAPKSAIPSLTRVDEGTVSMVRSIGVEVSSSAELVQFTKSLWQPDGRVAHYLAAHHLSKLRQEVLAWIGEQVRQGKSITERDAQQWILRGYKVRGLAGGYAMVAVNENTADPKYRPGRSGGKRIKEGDLVLISLAAHVASADRPIYAAQGWMAYVGAEVPDRYVRLFKIVARARDEAIDFIDDQVSRRKAVQGFEPDQKARAVIGEAGFADRFLHRTGHSLDTGLDGDGANIDSFETHDTRNLVQDSGFTVGPGVYIEGDFGVRSEVSVYLGRKGVEVTSPVQDAITPVLATK
jgi:Xaa-Pro aminopeptidase